MCVSLGTNKTDSPLLIDPDAVLALSVPSKHLQPIPGNGLQLRQRGCALDHLKLSHRDTLKVLKTRHATAVE